MFQVPLRTSTEVLEYPIWSLCALSPPVRSCLPAPCLPSLYGLFLCPCLVLPPLLWPPSSCFGFSGFPVCAFLRFLPVFGCVSCVLSRSVGAPVYCLFRIRPYWRYSVTLVPGWRFHFLPLSCFCRCVSGLGGLFVFGCVLVGPCPGSSWGMEI